MTKTSTPPPDSLCYSCAVRSGWRSLTSWTKVLVPLVVGILASLIGLAVSTLVHEATVDESIGALREARHQDREEVMQTRRDLIDEERSNSVAHTEILRGITRLETLLKAREERP